MTKKQRNLTADEKRLWRRVGEGLKKRRALPADPDEAEEPAPLTKPTAAEIAPRPFAPPRPKRTSPPQDRGNEKRVRRGKLEIGASLDLHGHTQETGRTALLRFVRAAQVRGDRTVIVITGVGRGGEGILKRRVPEWLGESDIRAFISGFAQAHRAHGGAGAFYVFIRRAG